MAFDGLKGLQHVQDFAPVLRDDDARLLHVRREALHVVNDDLSY
jgi:hypothetical protein